MALTKAHNRMIEGAAVNVKDYGAVGDGTADDTTAIQNAIDQGGSIHFPAGIYLVTDNIEINANYVKLIGAGKNETIISFVPSTSNIVFTFVASGVSNYAEAAVPTPNTALVQCGISGFGFTGTNSQVKTAIKLVTVTEFFLDDIAINDWAGTRSIGLHIKGHDHLSASNLSINCESAGDSNGIPILIDVGAAYESTGIDADHFNFHNLALVAGASYPCILGNAYGFWANVSFTGYQSWVKGTEGIKRTTSGFSVTGLTGTHGVISFNNIRTEQGDSATAYSIYLESSGTVKIDGCYFDATREGIYLRGGNTDSRVRILDTEYLGGSGRIGLNVESSIRTITWDSCFWQTGASMTLTDHRLRYGTLSHTNEIPSSAVYAVAYSTSSETLNYDGTKVQDSSVFTWKGTIAAGETSPNLSIGAGKYYDITVIGYDSTGKVIAGGKVIDYTNADASVIPIKLSGTSNFDAGNTVAKLNYYRVPENTSVAVIDNNLTNSVDVVVLITQFDAV